MANARMRLKELADKIPRSTIERACFSVHGDNQPPFRANVSVYDSCIDLRYFGCGQALTKRDAEEIAAADALFKAGVGAGDNTVPAAVRAQAWLGDAALDFIVALMGTKEGLSVAQMDCVSQRQLCNKALAGCAREQLASETLTATEVEASVGRNLTPLIDDLLELLLPALREANPELASDLRAAVIMETC